MIRKFFLMFKALRQLGWSELWPYLSYQFRLRSGILRLKTKTVRYAEAAENAGKPYLPLYPLPNLDELRAVLAEDEHTLLAEADEIINGIVRLFGSEPVPLRLKPEGEVKHWTRHTGSQHNGEDIKLIWEPARFGWAVTLGRAYLVNKDNRFAEAFWQLTETFAESNPPNIGPNWASGQEVALRLIALAFVAGLMADAPATTSERQFLLVGMVAAHAERILPTLDYARAQNNNLLISEAVGLYTAAVVLPEHPQARTWKVQGQRWLHHALQTQIAEDGTYSQHSTNYHRLMLQLALFARRLADDKMEPFSMESLTRLAAATHWLDTLLDRESGGVPNLGGNDGAYFLPLTSHPFSDFRPVLAAARQAFLGVRPKELEEMTLWLGGTKSTTPETPSPDVLRIDGFNSWAYLRVASFESRPAHADQLHLDLWWRGINIAADPGVVHYNADQPWDNPLDTTVVHNTLTVNDRPQMTKAGRFLWLDWAQALVLDTNRDKHERLSWAVAEHNGYRKLKVTHRRTVSVQGDLWMVRDQVLPVDESKASHKLVSVRLHWLLPDLEWVFNNGVLRLETDFGEVTLQVRCQEGEPAYSLVGAGEILFGDIEPDPVRGWFSPTYAEKVPALSLAAVVEAAPPVTITTNWHFPD